MPSSTSPAGIPAFVATTGGHLVQLYLLASILEPDRHLDALWITHPTPQSESMLSGRNVFFVPHIKARDPIAVLRRTPSVLRSLRRNHVDVVYSTGAAMALVALPASRLVGARPQFIESIARSSGPSLAGQVLERVPWVPVFTQYPQNASRRWRYEHSLLDLFAVETAQVATDPRRIFVTLGTTRPWQFRSLVERMLEILPDGCDVVWQTGVTDVAGLDIDARAMVTDEEFRAEIARADVVVSHAGGGTFMRCLEAGKVPILVPRRAARGEHVDDHQEQIAQVGNDRGLALMVEVGDLTYDDLRRAANLRTKRTDLPAPDDPGPDGHA